MHKSVLHASGVGGGGTNNNTQAQEQPRPQQKQQSFWSRLAKSTDLWIDSEQQTHLEEQQQFRNSRSATKMKDILPKSGNKYHSPKWIMQEACKSKRIIWIVSLTFIFMIFIGLTIALVLRSNISNTSMNAATATFEMSAYDASILFTKDLEKALGPLFVLQQYAFQSHGFASIPMELNNAPRSDTDPLYINTEGICNKLKYVLPFQSMTRPYSLSENGNGKTSSSLLFMELWPASVSCFRCPFKEYSVSMDTPTRALFDVSYLETNAPSEPPTQRPTVEAVLTIDLPTDNPTPIPATASPSTMIEDANAVPTAVLAEKTDNTNSMNKEVLFEIITTNSPTTVSPTTNPTAEESTSNPPTLRPTNTLTNTNSLTNTNDPTKTPTITNTNDPIKAPTITNTNDPIKAPTITNTQPVPILLIENTKIPIIRASNPIAETVISTSSATTIDNPTSLPSQQQIQTLDTSIVGRDYASDPSSSELITTIVNDCPSDKSIMNGPYKLSTDTNTTYNKVFMVSTPILYKTIPTTNRHRNLQHNNTSSKTWGIANILLNWNAYIQESNMHSMFLNRNLEFILQDKEQHIIEQSTNSKHITLGNSISYKISIVNYEWTLILSSSYSDNKNTPLSKSIQALSSWMIAIVVLTSIIISIMLLIILVDQQEQIALLRYLIPSKIMTKVQSNEVVIERYEEATVFVGQIIGFAALTGQISPVEVITLLNEIYEAFDSLVLKHKLVKMETMGDVYVVIGGGPELNSTPCAGAEKIANFALDAVNFVSNYKIEEGLSVYIRIGLATGHIIAGVIGSINKTFPKYTLFGDLLNFASLLQSTSKKMRIQTSESTHNLLCRSQNYTFKMKERTDGGAIVLYDITIPDVSSRTFWLTDTTPK